MYSSQGEQKKTPYKIDMDPDKALELVKHGASLLLLDVPPSTSFGMDTQVFAVGSNFKGVKMIPPGPHFVYYNAVSRHGNEFSPTTGFFIFPAPSEVFGLQNSDFQVASSLKIFGLLGQVFLQGLRPRVIVRQWDPQEERLVKLADCSEEERFALAVKNLEFDRYLGPYDLHHYQDWKHISSYITKDVIERLEPIGGEITIMSESELIEKGPQTAADRHLADQLSKARECIEHKTVKPMSGSQRCFYTMIPHSVKLKGMTAAELTAANLDKTQLLENLFDQKYGGLEDLLLGELQFSFIAFLMGQSLEAFGQWKAIVCLLLSCEEAPLHTRTKFFIKFLDVIILQLKQGFGTKSNSREQGTFPFLDDSWFSEDNFLQLLFQDFFSMIREAQPVDGELLYQAKRLKHVLEVNLGWCFRKEGGDKHEQNDEFAPVVVTEEELMHVEQDTII